MEIKIFLLGKAKYIINIKRIKRWKSKIFKISSIDSIQLLPNTDDQWRYSDGTLNNIIPNSNVLSFSVIDAPLDDNFYMRRLSGNKCVISMYETYNILKENNIEFEKFILRNIYEIVLVTKMNNNVLPESKYSITHDDIRKCLFDMNGIKNDIIYSIMKPNICLECKTNILKSGIAEDIIKKTEKELIKINKKLFFLIKEIIVKHPIISIIITSFWAILLNIFANFISNYFK